MTPDHKETFMTRYSILTLAAIGLLVAGPVRAAAPAQVNPSPFDSQDPEILKLKALNWKAIDFDALDLKTRCTALLAMKVMLNQTGGKADARIDLLMDYMEMNKLGEKYVRELADPPELPHVTYDEAKKIAAAFVKSPAGANQFGDNLEGCDEQMLRAYEKMYAKASRTEFESAIEARQQARSMGVFLQKIGKFEEFSKWSLAERDRRQAEYKKKLEADRTAAAAAAQKKSELAAQRLAAMQDDSYEGPAGPMISGRTTETSGVRVAPEVVLSPPVFTGFYLDNGWGWAGAYYASNAYRGAVNDRLGANLGAWNAARLGRP
jgi:hypothetical protein